MTEHQSPFYFPIEPVFTNLQLFERCCVIVDLKTGAGCKNEVTGVLFPGGTESCEEHKIPHAAWEGWLEEGKAVWLPIAEVRKRLARAV